MSDSQWFYSDAQQQQLGPVTFAQIQQLAATGQIQANTLIWNEGMPNWTPANQVQGVFNASSTPAAPANPAAAQNPYTAPATPAGATMGGNYPAPFVKKASFPLYLGLLLGSIALLILSGALATPPEVPDLSEENRQFSQAETAEEVAQAQEAIRVKTEAFKTEFKSDASNGLALGGIGLAWLLSIFSTIYGYIIMYRAWHVLQPGGARTTPGKAIGFMFIPFFNIYWIFNAFVGWATDWNRIRSSYPDLQAAPVASRGMFIASLVCILTLILAPIGMILFLICKKQMCDTVNFFAQRQSAGLS